MWRPTYNSFWLLNTKTVPGTWLAQTGSKMRKLHILQRHPLHCPPQLWSFKKGWVLCRLWCTIQNLSGLEFVSPSCWKCSWLRTFSCQSCLGISHCWRGVFYPSTQLFSWRWPESRDWPVRVHKFLASRFQALINSQPNFWIFLLDWGLCWDCLTPWCLLCSLLFFPLLVQWSPVNSLINFLQANLCLRALMPSELDLRSGQRLKLLYEQWSISVPHCSRAPWLTSGHLDFSYALFWIGMFVHMHACLSFP